MSPGAPAGAPGLHPVMSNQKTYERVAALLHETVELLQRGDDAPYSPVDTFVPGKMRRTMRRGAERLRRGELLPRFRNLWTAEELAEICERTAARDEIRHQVTQEFIRKGREMARLIEEDPEEARQAMFAVHLEMLQLANAHGPGSEAARRYAQLQRLTQLAKTLESDTRRQKAFGRPRDPAAARDAGGLIPLVPAEILGSAPAGEAILPFPAPGEDSGRRRILIRIGVGASSWIGSFESGFKTTSTVFMMPDGKHLFVSAGGAGYILDTRSRRLVERTGTEIVGVIRDEAMTLCVINHNGVRFEAFGPAGRLWKSEGAQGGRKP